MKMVNKRTILIVDDESLPRILLSTSLKEAGYDVCEANGGRTALQLLRERAFDVVLLDLIMPEMDGFHVLKQIKSDNLLRNIPVVVVSASDHMDSVVRCIEMGAVDHLSKPFDPVLLHERVRAALAIKQAEGELVSLMPAGPAGEEDKGVPQRGEGEAQREEKTERGMVRPPGTFLVPASSFLIPQLPIDGSA